MKNSPKNLVSAGAHKSVILVSLLALAGLCLPFPVHSKEKKSGGGEGGQGASSSNAKRQGNLQVGQQAPDFTLKDLDGKPMTLSTCHTGKPIFLIFGNYT